MLIDGERALAWVARIDSVTPLEGYDRVEYAHIGGWGVVVSKADAFKAGDLCVYFEIDSKVPETDERFAFMERRGWRVRTQRMCHVYSQGLVMPLSDFPEIVDPHEGLDVTEVIGVTYHVPEDNERKARTKERTLSDKVLATAPVRALMRNERARRLILRLLGREVHETVPFPTRFAHVHKTDEERIENMPQVTQLPQAFVATEKLDGTSATYVLERSRHVIGRARHELWVCSRNRRIDPKAPDAQGRIYLEPVEHYDIERYLGELADARDLDYVCVQGEIVGPGVQGNPLGLMERDLFLFNLITSDEGRWPTMRARELVREWGMRWVPVVDADFHMPQTESVIADMEKVKRMSDGRSLVSPDKAREGLVFRDDAGLSFKSVSRKYLEKKG